MKNKVIMGITVAALCMGSTALGQRSPAQDRERTPAIDQQQQTTPRAQARPQTETRRDQQQTERSERLGARREIAGEQPEDINRARKLIDMEIKTHKGEEVGKIHDVVIDLDSGRVAYVVVSLEGVEGAGAQRQQQGQQQQQAQRQQQGQQQAQRPGQQPQQQAQRPGQQQQAQAGQQGQQGEQKLIAVPLGAFVKAPDGDSLVLHIEKERLATARTFSEENLPAMTTATDPVVMSFWQIYIIDPAGAEPGQERDLEQRQQELKERLQQQQQQQERLRQQQDRPESRTPTRPTEPNR
jgi:sporulation protein YlmC with PRC-barrel domain